MDICFLFNFFFGQNRATNFSFSLQFSEYFFLSGYFFYSLHFSCLFCFVCIFPPFQIILQKKKMSFLWWIQVMNESLDLGLSNKQHKVLSCSSWLLMNNNNRKELDRLIFHLHLPYFILMSTRMTDKHQRLAGLYYIVLWACASKYTRNHIFTWEYVYCYLEYTFVLWS